MMTLEPYNSIQLALIAAALSLTGCAGLSEFEMRQSETCHAWDDNADVKIRSFGGMAYDMSDRNRTVAMMSKEGIIAIGSPNYIIAQFVEPDILAAKMFFGFGDGAINLRLLGDRTENFSRLGTSKVNYSPRCAPMDAAIASAAVIHVLQTQPPTMPYLPAFPAVIQPPPPEAPDHFTMPPPPKSK